MIRRDLIQPDGQHSWLLISQISHAQLAADLARGWNGWSGQRSPSQQEFLAAVVHHDDGWASWDAEPGVDLDSLKPANFNEMLLGESLAIWRHSISRSKHFGPLTSYTVAGHFCALLRRFDTWKESPTKRQLAEKFLTYYDQKMVEWLSVWQSGDQVARSVGVADTAVSWLQFFDALSLWFCTAGRVSPETFTTPEGGMVTFAPMASDCMAVTPWPWEHSTVEVRISGRQVPTDRYADAKALAAAPGVEVELKWRLEPQVKPLV